MLVKKDSFQLKLSKFIGKKKNSGMGILGLFVFTAIALTFSLMYVPGYLAYRAEIKRRTACPFIAMIHKSLNGYSETESHHLFPLKIENYGVLSHLVSSQGGLLPEKQSDTKIDSFQYETNDRKSYLLRINIRGNEQYFYVLLPMGIIEIAKFDSIDDEPIMNLVRRIAYIYGDVSAKDLVGGDFMKIQPLADYFGYKWNGCRTVECGEKCVQLFIRRTN